MSTTRALFTDLAEAFAALRKDLAAPGGPAISTMRNYRYAIVPYPPDEELALRRHVERLSLDLEAQGWRVLVLPLHALLLARVRREGDGFVAAIIETEKRLHRRNPERALNTLLGDLRPLLEGPDGLARDIVRAVDDFRAAHPAPPERTLVVLTRAGALYPFCRTSALLKHIDGPLQQVPVVLCYPGHRVSTGDGGAAALSFMGRLDPDRDYRPRIYG